MINKSEFQIVTGKKMVNYTEEPLNITLSDANLKIAVSWDRSGTDLLGDDAYGKIHLTKVSLKFNETAGTLWPVSDATYDFHPCSEEEFPPLQTEVTIGRKKLYCFDDLSLFNISYKDSNEYQTGFHIAGIKKCTSGISIED